MEGIKTMNKNVPKSETGCQGLLLDIVVIVAIGIVNCIVNKK